MFIFLNPGHEEFIKLILLLFCLAQRLFLPCDTQSGEVGVTTVSQLDKCLKFVSIRGDKNDYILYKITT